MGRCWCTESCRVHTRQWGKIKTAEPRHRHNYAPGLHNTLSSFMLLCYWLGTQLSYRPKSSKGSQEYLNAAFWKLERLSEYTLNNSLRFMWKLLMLTIYTFHSCIPAYKCLRIIFQKLTAIWQKLLSSPTLMNTP